MRSSQRIRRSFCGGGRVGGRGGGCSGNSSMTGATHEFKVGGYRDNDGEGWWRERIKRGWVGAAGTACFEGVLGSCLATLLAVMWVRVVRFSFATL